MLFGEVGITGISNSISGRRQLDVDMCFVRFVTYGENQAELNKLAHKLNDPSEFRHDVQTNLHNTIGTSTVNHNILLIH